MIQIIVQLGTAPRKEVQDSVQEELFFYLVFGYHPPSSCKTVEKTRLTRQNYTAVPHSG